MSNENTHTESSLKALALNSSRAQMPSGARQMIHPS